MADLLIRDAEVDGRIADVLVRGDTIAEIGAGLRPAGDAGEFDAAGGAVLPGLHDHHVHLLAMAARRQSVPVGPPAVRSPTDLDAVVTAAHRAADPAAWLRLVDHDESSGGELDRLRLDALAPRRAVRAMHRSGACWTLSSAGLAAVNIPDEPGQQGRWPPGVELDASGAPTGRLWRLDDWLRSRLPPIGSPDLAPVGRLLAARGITGVTDATATADIGYFAVLASAVQRGELPLDVTVMGGLQLAAEAPPAPLRRGPVKLVLSDHQAPDPDVLARDIAAAHAARRPVAIHCVTRPAAAVCVAAWSAVGSAPGDRLEHGSVLDDTLGAELAALGITVVTQPAFVLEHGDRYLAEVDPGDLPDLYRLRSLLDVGVRLGGSTDAPHGTADPWRALTAAVERTTQTGASLGPSEALDPAQALALFTTHPDDPGGRARRVAVGAPADLCVLDRPYQAASVAFDRVGVVFTVRHGAVTFVTP